MHYRTDLQAPLNPGILLPNRCCNTIEFECSIIPDKTPGDLLRACSGNLGRRRCDRSCYRRRRPGQHPGGGDENLILTSIDTTRGGNEQRDY